MAKPPDDSTHPMSRAEWRAWLEAHHTRATGVWLISFKKATAKPQVEYGEAVEEALCFGWVDNKSRSLDEERTMIWFAPRKARSGWSRSNKQRVDRLLAQGLMTAAGLATIEKAKQNGSWTALDAVETLEISPDLGAALATYPKAAKYFDAFPRSVKRSILEWIASAKKPETRARRVEETARLAADNIRANQWQPRSLGGEKEDGSSA